MSDYTNQAQQRLLKALTVLAGHEVHGLAPIQIARALDSSASNTTRDLANLVEGGFAERLENGNYRLGPKPVQISLAYTRGLVEIKSRVEEIEQRFSRVPK